MEGALKELSSDTVSSGSFRQSLLSQNHPLCKLELLLSPKIDQRSRIVGTSTERSIDETDSIAHDKFSSSALFDEPVLAF